MQADLIYPILRLAFLELEAQLLGAKPAANFASAYKQPGNRFSAANINYILANGQIVAASCAYTGHQAAALDRALSEICQQPIATECLEDEFYLDSIAVAPAHRGKGYFKQLLNRAQKRAAELGLAKISLLTKTPEVYTSSGFAVVEEFHLGDQKYLKMIKYLND